MHGEAARATAPRVRVSALSVGVDCEYRFRDRRVDRNSKQAARHELRLRKERDPRFVERYSLLSRRYRIYVGREGHERLFQFSRRQFEELTARVREHGVALVGAVGRERLWWVGREDLFWADDDLAAEDVELLIWDRHRRQSERLHRLRKIRVHDVQADAARRERIPADVRHFVWRRDDGRCVRCGAEEDLQFDHVIPYSRGGANSVENIQILCGSCNREKGDAIA